MLRQQAKGRQRKNLATQKTGLQIVKSVVPVVAYQTCMFGAYSHFTGAQSHNADYQR